MYCPKCGRPIPEGKLYCEFCGEEIHIVPEYDADMEEQLNISISQISEEVRKHRAEEEQQRILAEARFQHKRKIFILICGIAAGVFGAIAVFLILQIYFMQSYTYNVGRAYALAERGRYDEAAEKIDHVIGRNGTNDSELLLTEADYLKKAGEYDAAESCVWRSISDENISEEQRAEAYDVLVDIYSASGNYTGLAETLSHADDEFILNRYSEYLISIPTFTQPEGTYPEVFYLTLDVPEGETVFYTIDGSTPSLGSSLYDKPVALAAGKYDISAIAVNKFGVTSDVVSATYTVTETEPDPPEVEPSSGNYDISTEIVVNVPEGADVYYTEDGTEPDLTTEHYTGPIKMPDGDSEFRFAVISAGGVKSSTVVREYSLSGKTVISSTNGPAYVIAALIRSGLAIDSNGMFPDGSAHFSYIPLGSTDIAGKGNFLLYSETLNDVAGNSAATGRSFAVNSSTGEVFLYVSQTDGEPVLSPVG